MNIRFKKTVSVGIALSLVLSLTACVSERVDTNQISEKDDYYEAVNQEVINDWEIAPDESVVNWFSIAQDRIDERMAELISDISEGETQDPGSDESNIRAMYLTGMDIQARDENGFGKTLTDFFGKVDAAQTIEELERACMEMDKQYGIGSVFKLSVSSDLQDSTRQVLVAEAGDHGIDKEIWLSDDESNKNVVSYYLEFLAKLYEIQGYSEAEAKAAAEDTAKLMKTLASKALSQEETYNPEKTYNVFSVSQLEELFQGNISSEMIEEIYGVAPDDQVIVPEVEMSKTMASYLIEENLPLLKQYVKICIHKAISQYIDMESYNVLMEYSRKAQGMEEETPFEEQLILDLQDPLGFECGRLYCEKYYSEETTEEVAGIIDQVVAIFGQRIGLLDWMSEETKAEAQKKLDSLEVRIGHPEKWPQDNYEVILLSPEDGGSYIENYLMVCHALNEYMFEKKDEPTDKTQWPDTPQTVNAYYDPQTNSINILAGILQDPFYNLDSSDEEKLGGIGAIIGHEITHAFDTTGSMFDEKGNLRDWWTQADKESFQKLADEVIAYYDGMEAYGKQINGAQTISENIADLGGVACITEIAQEKQYDLKEVYEAYARIWASKQREEYLAQQVAVDVHAPAKIRVNAVLSAQQAFRDTYDITEEDGMYQKDMPKIW